MQATRARSKAEPVFHPDSYGYRAGRSALDAVGQSRRRYWRADWHGTPGQAAFPGTRHAVMVYNPEASRNAGIMT